MTHFEPHFDPPAAQEMGLSPPADSPYANRHICPHPALLKLKEAFDDEWPPEQRPPPSPKREPKPEPVVAAPAAPTAQQPAAPAAPPAAPGVVGPAAGLAASLAAAPPQPGAVPVGHSFMQQLQGSLGPGVLPVPGAPPPVVYPGHALPMQPAALVGLAQPQAAFLAQQQPHAL